MFILIYRLITSPIAAIKESEQSVPVKAGLCGLFVHSIVQAITVWLNTSFWNLGIATISMFMINMIFILVSTTAIDFIAQCVGLKAQSKAFFFWVCTTLLFKGIMLPLFLMRSWIASEMYFLVDIGLMCFIIYLQIKIISHRYKIRTMKSILLYMSPLLFFIVIFILFIIVVSKSVLNYLPFLI